MKIAILASEGAPYVKSGGLGDVMEALPSALARIPGNEVVLILPYYKKIRGQKNSKIVCSREKRLTISYLKPLQYAEKLHGGASA